MPKKSVRFPASPVGVFTAAFLDRPSQKFGNFSATLVIEAGAKNAQGQTVEEVYEWLKQKLAEHRAELEAESPKYKRYSDYLFLQPEENEETGEATGRWILRASQKAEYKLKTGEVRHAKVALFDAKKRPLKGVKIGRGSTGRVAGNLRFYDMDNKTSKVIGVGLYLEGAQILELVEFGNQNADAFGFGEEQGYEFSETEGGMGFEDESGETASSSSDNAETPDF